MMIRKILSAMKAQGFRVFTEPYQLNIVGIRADSTRANRFDDKIAVFYKDSRGRWKFKAWPATTDPGTFWLRSPMHPQGTAMMCAQQVIDGYGIALHRGKYRALCQIHKAVCVVRDYNRDETLDFGSARKMSGMFGINIHRASNSGTTKEVEKYSAGCQVFANADDFDEFIGLCETHRQFHDNYFTYSLIDLRELRRAGRRKWLLRGSLFAGIAALSLWAYHSIFKN